jgi:hypothetical protein
VTGLLAFVIVVAILMLALGQRHALVSVLVVTGGLAYTVWNFKTTRRDIARGRAKIAANGGKRSPWAGVAILAAIGALTLLLAFHQQ